MRYAADQLALASLLLGIGVMLFWQLVAHWPTKHPNGPDRAQAPRAGGRSRGGG